MTTTAPVSVIIPAYNAAPFLAAAVDSVRAQSLQPAEIVVVDDGSTDTTGAEAQQLDVRYFRQENAGPAAARNRGLRESRSPLVAFLDADDAFLPDKLARQVDLLERPGAVASCTDAWVVRDAVRQGRKNEGRVVPQQIDLDELLRGNPVICSTVLARREALLQLGGFDEDRGLIATEDYDLWLRISGTGPIAYLDEPLTEYRVHGDSLSDSMTFLRGIDRIAERIAPSLAGERLALLQRLRARLRVDAAYDRARAGEGALARQLLREARGLGAPRWAAFKILLRSLV